MTIAIEFEPEIEAQLKASAKTRGLSLDEYVREVVVDRMQSAIENQPVWVRDPDVRESIARAHAELVARIEAKRSKPRPSMQEFLDAMAYRGPVPEQMRTQEITREFIYGDHP